MTFAHSDALRRNAQVGAPRLSGKASTSLRSTSRRFHGFFLSKDSLCL
jgi:hypothetical protein